MSLFSFFLSYPPSNCVLNPALPRRRRKRKTDDDDDDDGGSANESSDGENDGNATSEMDVDEEEEREPSEEPPAKTRATRSSARNAAKVCCFPLVASEYDPDVICY